MTDSFSPQSSNIEQVTYDPAMRDMTVKFKSGGEYVHHNVGSQDFAAFKAADSAGGHYHRHIKGRFRFTKLAGKDDDGG